VCPLAMVDKCDARVLSAVPFTREFGKVYADLRNDPKGPFHSSQYYLTAGDLRNYGYEIRLHMNCKYGKGDNKIELLDAGYHSFAFLVNEVQRIFEIDPLQLELIRVDVAADVPDVPVTWFLANARVKGKRFHLAGTGNFEYQQLGQKGIETIYHGKRPNCDRIYNKIAEYEHQYRRFKRRASRDAEIPSFETLYGMSQNAILTRVERQIGGGKVAEQMKVSPGISIRTVGDLMKHGRDFNPYSNLELLPRARALQPAYFGDINQYMAVMFARERLEDWGLQPFFQWLNVETNRNARRWLNKYGQWLSDSPGVTVAEIYERYRNSISKQLAA